MICPNWLVCSASETECIHRKVHSFVDDATMAPRAPVHISIYKGCNKVSTLPESTAGCLANNPRECIVYPCLRVLCGGCIGVEEDDLS
jgi:hypothetical protein